MTKKTHSCFGPNRTYSFVFAYQQNEHLLTYKPKQKIKRSLQSFRVEVLRSYGLPQERRYRVVHSAHYRHVHTMSTVLNQLRDFALDLLRSRAARSRHLLGCLVVLVALRNVHLVESQEPLCEVQVSKFAGEM